MPFVTEQKYNSPDHLQEIFDNTFHIVSIASGELERLRAIEREAKAISDAISRNHALDQTFVQGSLLRNLIRLIGREMAMEEAQDE